MRAAVAIITLASATVVTAQQQQPINPRQQPGATVHIFAPDQHDLYDGLFRISANRIYMVGGLNDPEGWDHLDNVPAQTARTRPTPAILFMCPHGAAKSLMASAYFQKIAKERGLNVRVDSAGTEPDAQLSKGVVAHLGKNGYAIPIEKPRAANGPNSRARRRTDEMRPASPVKK